jgi:hypothetical protein
MPSSKVVGLHAGRALGKQFRESPWPERSENRANGANGANLALTGLGVSWGGIAMDAQSSASMNKAAERLIVAKIDGQFTLLGVPRSPLSAPHFYIRAGEAVEGPMTFMECRNRLSEHMDADDCRVVERVDE